jgi:cytochrome c oxidase subunit II
VSPNRSAPRRDGAEGPGGAASRSPGQATAGGRATPRPGSPRRLRRLAPRAVLAAVLLTVITGCKSTAFTRLGMPPPVTKQGQVTLTLWQGSWIAAWAVGAIVWGLIIWAVIFYRKRSDRVPQQVRYNLPIEFLYTIVPFVMVGVLFYFTARDENYIDKLSPHPEVIVNVTGYQWSWQFQYPQYKVPGSETHYVTEHGYSWPGRLPVMEIPTGETVQFNLSSTDVIHAFWVVPFEFKRDVLPDHPNHFEVTPIKTGTFTGRCTELCGLYHSRMLFTLKIVTPQQFRQWISTQQAQQELQVTSQNASGGTQ